LSAADEAQAWSQTVEALASERGLRYEPVGGINPADAPMALCVGGTNRLTGELAKGFWGSSCDANEQVEGRFRSKAVLPHAVLCKAHMPDLAAVMPAFDVESIEARPQEMVRKRVARKVAFESSNFNKRFLATVPSQYDPIALRELFSPAFIEWVTKVDNEIDFGVSDRQLFFLWRLADRSEDQLTAALDAGGELFRRVQREMEEHGVNTYPAGPWHAGMEKFPSP
jgi:hypothetical protein